MEATLKRILKKGLLFFVVLLALFVIQCIINRIPKRMVETNIIKSLEEIKASGNNGNRRELVSGLPQTIQDRFGDVAWLQVVYNIDEKTPVKSTLESNRYVEYNNFQSELEKQIQNNLEPNEMYNRYWHGMTMLLRPLLVFLSLNQIKVVLSVILFGLLLCYLIRTREKRFAILFMIAYIVVAGFFSCLSVEYMPVFLILPVVLMILERVQESKYEIVLLITGLFTAYFDFLTAETLTLTVPLLYLCFCHKKEMSNKRFILLGIHWGWLCWYLWLTMAYQ